MKVGGLVVSILKLTSHKGCLKRRKIFPPYGLFKNEKINIPYIDDGNPQHTFDVIYAEENRKDVVIFDIHGGGYVFGEHQDNYFFMSKFVEQGYDAVLMDYEPNNGKMDTLDLVKDLAKNFNYVFEHAEELGLKDKPIVITGDSAGGHLALLFAELLCDKEYAKQVELSFPKVNLKCCLVNSPVYDYLHIADDNLSRSGAKRMFGPNYFNKEATALICPRVHLSSLKCPLFVSTSKLDFIRGESLLLKQDAEERNLNYEFIDLDSDNKKAGHVHNVIHPENPEGIQINNAMMQFILKS